VVGSVRCSLLCKFAPLTRHIPICSLRYRIECILSETLVFKCTSEEAFPIFCIHFLAKFSSFVLMVDGPAKLGVAAEPSCLRHAFQQCPPNEKWKYSFGYSSNRMLPSITCAPHLELRNNGVCALNAYFLTRAT
jgi:hypothetical protein